MDLAWNKLQWLMCHKTIPNQARLETFKYWLYVYYISVKFILLYIDLRPSQTCHSKDGGSAYSIGVGELGRRYGIGLKSHGTLTDWCTGKEWHVYCMTVISTWWRSNMPFKRRRKWHIPMASYGEILSGRLNYYKTLCRQEVS